MSTINLGGLETAVEAYKKAEEAYDQAHDVWVATGGVQRWGPQKPDLLESLRYAEQALIIAAVRFVEVTQRLNAREAT